MSAQPSPSKSSHTWIGCVLTAFVVAALMFFVPWESFAVSGAGLNLPEMIARVAEGAVSLLFLPLGLLASWVGYRGLVLVAVAGLMALAALSTRPYKWQEKIEFFGLFYLLFGVFFGLLGLVLVYTDRSVNFVESATPTQAFRLVDSLSAKQVQTIRKAMVSGRRFGNERAVVSQVVGQGALDTKYFYFSNTLLSPFGFISRSTEDFTMQTGPVCANAQRNYLRSAVMDRYQMKINGVVVSKESPVGCRWFGFNTVVVSYRGDFAAK